MSDAAEILAEHKAAAERALDAAAGSSSLCTLSRSGKPMPGIKYPEGAWVALREVELVSVGGSIIEACAHVRGRWAAEVERHAAQNSGPDWIAYSTGGLDAVDALAEALRGSASTA